MTRKTLKVEDLRVKINSMLADSTCTPDVRQGMIHVLESTLHETGNYNGFNYLEKRDVKEGQLPGVNMNEDGTLPDYVTRFKNTDDTRRAYY